MNDDERMNDDGRFPDIILNAYVDGELASEDRARIDRAMARDAGLRERVERLRRLKQMVQDAYTDETPSGRPLPAARRWAPGWPAIAAAVAAFALGGLLSWGLLTWQDVREPPRVASAPAGNAGAVDAASPVKVVFHISRGEVGRLETILNETEALLNTAAEAGREARVRIIASGDALTLFQRDEAREADRIAAMTRRHGERLAFNGCSVAFKNLERDAGGEGFKLLPQVRLVDLGVMELMRRQNQGWAYVRL